MLSMHTAFYTIFLYDHYFRTSESENNKKGTYVEEKINILYSSRSLTSLRLKSDAQF